MGCIFCLFGLGYHFLAVTCCRRHCITKKKEHSLGRHKDLYAINSLDIHWSKSQHITGSETGYTFWESGLKYGMEKRIFWSEIGCGFSGPGSTPPPKNIMSKPPQFQPSLRLSTGKKQILLYPVLDNCTHYSYLIGAWKFTGIILFTWVKSIFGFGNQFLEIDIIWLPHAALGLNCGQHFWTCSSEWGHIPTVQLVSYYPLSFSSTAICLYK